MDLSLALLAYSDRSYRYSMLYILDSIKEFHFTFHNKRINTGISGAKR